MGCAQTSANVIPPNDISVERLYDNESYPLPPNHIPNERLHDNDGYTLTNAPPTVIITVPPPPAYVKSVLKKSHSNGRGKTERLSFFNRKLPPVNKSVNFDEQVLVKARTPTPSKIWYEKASSTMPKRKHPRNDDDEDDYDDEIESVTSDEEQENNEQINIESQISNLILQRNQANTFWHNPNTIGFMPTTNTMIENQSFSPSMQRSPFNMNTYATETTIPLPINRIIVRRRLSPPPIAPAPSYRSRRRSSTVSPYQSTTQPSTVPAYRIPTQTSLVSPYQSSVKPLTLPSYQSPIQRTIPNPNVVLNEHQPTLTNDESSSQTANYPINRHPIENVT